MRGKLGLGWGTLLCLDGGDHRLGVLPGCQAERKDVTGEGEFSTSKSILCGFQLFLWGLGGGGPSALVCSAQVMLLHPSKVKERSLWGKAASLRPQQPGGPYPGVGAKGEGLVGHPSPLTLLAVCGVEREEQELPIQIQTRPLSI